METSDPLQRVFSAVVPALLIAGVTIYSPEISAINHEELNGKYRDASITVKHAGASNFPISIRQSGRGYDMCIQDDGAGIATKRNQEIGLIDMKSEPEYWEATCRSMLQNTARERKSVFRSYIQIR